MCLQTIRSLPCPPPCRDPIHGFQPSVEALTFRTPMIAKRITPWADNIDFHHHPTIVITNHPLFNAQLIPPPFQWFLCAFFVLSLTFIFFTVIFSLSLFSSFCIPKVLCLFVCFKNRSHCRFSIFFVRLLLQWKQNKNFIFIKVPLNIWETETHQFPVYFPTKNNNKKFQPPTKKSQRH